MQASYYTFCSIGRPKIVIPIEEIEFLRQLRFSWTRIAEILGISRSTLYRQLEDEGISQSITFSSISDIELDAVVNRIKQTHPNDGERMLIGHLTRLNVCRLSTILVRTVDTAPLTTLSILLASIS